jgi:hypothetical protein
LAAAADTGVAVEVIGRSLTRRRQGDAEREVRSKLLAEEKAKDLRLRPKS